MTKAKVVKLISFKLLDGKNQGDALEALKGITNYFSKQAGSKPGTVMHDPEEDTYYVFAPADSIDDLSSQSSP